MPAFAGQVVLRYPTFQGKPILSHTNDQGGNFNPNATLNAHLVCRLHGHARSVIAGYDRATFETAVVARANTEVFIPASVMNRDSLGLIAANMDHDYGHDLALNPRATPQFFRMRRAHPCAEVSVCRGFHPDRFRTDPMTELNSRHPYMQACYRWGTSDRTQPIVFTSVTCETTARPWQQEIARQATEFHRATGERLRVVPGSAAQMGITLADPVQTCQRTYARGSQGSLRTPQVGECDFQPWEPRWGSPAPLMDESMIMYLILTGRYREGERSGPACVQEILRKYASAVVRPEYQLGELINHMKLPFCVEGVEPVVSRSTALGTVCEVRARTRDMLQTPTTLRIQRGSDGATEATVRAQCDELARCFAHEELSCARANFCPAPGTTSRRPQ